jgi:hypothetical protein
MQYNHWQRKNAFLRSGILQTSTARVYTRFDLLRRETRLEGTLQTEY